MCSGRHDLDLFSTAPPALAAPSVSPAAIHQSKRKCDNWLAQKTEAGAPYHYEDRDIFDPEEPGPGESVSDEDDGQEQMDEDDIAIDDSISHVIANAKVSKGLKNNRQGHFLYTQTVP